MRIGKSKKQHAFLSAAPPRWGESSAKMVVNQKRQNEISQLSKSIKSDSSSPISG